MKVVFTARRLKPGHYSEFRKAWEPEQFPDGFRGAYLLRDTKDPDHRIQFGIVRADNMQAFRATLMPEGQKMLDAIEPFIDRIGLDTTYELVEEVAPVHA